MTQDMCHDQRRPDDPAQMTLTEVFQSLTRLGSGDRVTFGDMVEYLGQSAHGLLMLAFALPSCLPMPPGIPTTCGIAILAISVQILTARKTLYLPGFILRKSIARSDLTRMIDKARPVLHWVERISRPRASWAVGTVGVIVIGALGAICGLTLIAPIPFVGNLPPGYISAILAIGLIQRDGLAVILGTILFVLFMGLLVALSAGLLTGADQIMKLNIF